MLSSTAVAVLLFGVFLIGLVLLAAAFYTLRRPQQIDPNGTKITVTIPDGDQALTLMLPSAQYVAAMRDHVESRRSQLAKLSRGAQLASDWKLKSDKLRLTMLRSQREEVQLAVGGYVGGSDTLLQILVPELGDDKLDHISRVADAFPKLLQQLTDGRLPEAREPGRRAFEDAIGSFLKTSGLSKQDRASRSGFLAVFRKSCLVAFGLAMCEEMGAKGRQRAVERKEFFKQILKGGAKWTLSAVVISAIPRLMEVDWVHVLIG